jgi:hypothetical protein
MSLGGLSPPFAPSKKEKENHITGYNPCAVMRSEKTTTTVTRNMTSDSFLRGAVGFYQLRCLVGAMVGSVVAKVSSGNNHIVAFPVSSPGRCPSPGCSAAASIVPVLGLEYGDKWDLSQEIASNIMFF